MLITKTCNSCGAALSDDAPLAVCPRCVARHVLGQTAHAIGDAAENFSPHSTASVEQTGEYIGPYKLLQQIGEGGFGVVFLAEQERPLKRRVALKIIKPGMDTRQVIARFEAERQALALMDHPNIAKVLDAGTTGEGARDWGLEARKENEFTSGPAPRPQSPAPHLGRPYFVMELVQGVPITEYCDQCNLTTRERLELFITVCQAVQHAHQKGIIHRDIKPTNVLVAMQDGQPTPKIIDFGVAKAIGQQLTEHTLTTAFAQMVGTPLYMSPEQAELSPLGVDTRSDIYSLGVLLYELLTGATPFDKDRLHSASYDELRRIIREEEPPRPSARITTLAAEKASTVAEHRRTDTRRLSQQVRGELDWIVMKCLEKDRNRRYETPNSLARDIERYLQDEPVQACPPSAIYRFRKFARRNKALLTAGGAIAAALLVGLGLSTWMFFRATTESARAKAVSDLLQEMLGSADAARAKGVDYKVRELLDDFAGGLGIQLADEPETEADIRATVGRAYRSLKLPEKAQPHFEKAIEIRRRVDGPQSEELAAVLVDGAWNLLDQQRQVEAETQTNDALKIYRARGITGAPLFHAMEILQHILISAKRDEDAERVTQEALDVARQSGEEFPDQANLLHRYASLKISQGKFKEAEKIALESVDMHYRLHGDEHPETAFGLKVLANAQREQQKLVEAETTMRYALTIFRRQFPEDHPNTRDTRYQLRTILEARGDKLALDELDKEVAAIAMRSGSPEYHVRLAEILTNQSRPVLRPGDAQRLSSDASIRAEEAHRHVRQAIEMYGRMAVEQPDDLDRRTNAIAGLIEVVKVCVAAPGFANEVDEVNRRLTAEVPKLLADFPNSSDCQWRSAVKYQHWALALAPYSAHLATTEHAFIELIEILEKLSLSNPKRPSLWWFLADSYVNLGEAYWRLRRTGDAAEAFRRAIEIYDEHAAEIAADPTLDLANGIAPNYVLLAYFLVSTHRENEAAELMRKAADYVKRVTRPGDSIPTLGVLALIQLRLHDVAGYRENCKALAEMPVDIADDLTKVQSITLSCCGPDALEDMSPMVKRAEQLVANNSLGQRHVVLYILGAALYRDGKYERAEERLEESIDAYPIDPALGHDVINYQRLFLAMTKWKLNKLDEARALLVQTLPDLDKKVLSASCFWTDRLALETMRREAVALIEPKAADEAVENDNPQKMSNDE